MKKTILAGILVLASGPITANAAFICSMCEVIDGAAGTYIGSYDPTAFDVGTFKHTDIQADVGQDTPFNDFLLFDLNPAANGSILADFIRSTAVLDFEGALWSDGGSTCASGTPSACSAVVPGSELYRVTSVDDRLEIIATGLPAGRYIIQITGATRESGPSSYAGQLAFFGVPVPEPTSLALLGLGLLGVGYRRRHTG